MRPRRGGSRLTAFLLGLVAGGLGGILLIEFGIGLPVLAVPAIAVGCAIRPRWVGAGGTLIGWGATWIALLSIAARACATDQTCGDSPPNLVPWIVVGAGLIAIGLGLLVRSARAGLGPGSPTGGG